MKKRSLIAGAVGALLLIVTLAVSNLPGTETQGVGTYRNWSADAIVAGGAITEKELLSKYDQNASGVQSVYRHYGIARADLAGQTSDIKHGVVYQDGRVVVGGKTVATNAHSVARKPFYDTSGNGPKTVNINGSSYYEGPNMSIFVRPVDAYVLYRDGQFYRAILSSCANPVMATPTEKPKPSAKPQPKPQDKPVYACDSLEAKKIDRTRYRFTANATARDGARIAHHVYDFGDGNTRTLVSDTTTHEYSEPGSYTGKVTVGLKVGSNSERRTATSEDCEVTIKIEAKTEQPVYRCDGLTARAIQGKDRTYSYTLSYTAENGAELDKVTYDFGDSNKTTKMSASSVEHQYAAAGSYTTTATLYFDVTENGTTTERSDNCKVTITIPKPDNCPVPGKEDLPKNSPECVQPPIENPPELPQTGIGEILAGSAGFASIAASAYYWNMSDRNLRKAMLGK